MAEFGLLPTGFVPKTTQIVIAEMSEDIKGIEGPSFDTSDGSAAGELFGIVGAAVGELWEVAQQLASSTDRDSATGVSLDAIGALTGTIRDAAFNSTVVATLTGDPLTLISIGFTGTTASTGAPFKATENTVLVALAAWTISTFYALGARVTHAAQCYQCTVAGTSAGSGGPTGESTAITDGTVTWAWLGAGTAAVDAKLTAVASGAVVAGVRDLTVIGNPTVGLLHITNLAASVAGDLVEADPPYRIRQVEELAGEGAATAAAVRAKLLAITGVTAAHVFMNLTDTTDADGVPPHAVEALVQGGDDQEIVDLLGEEVVTGITTVGTSSGSHTDSEGTTFTVRFSRPGELLGYMDVTLTKNAVTYTGDTDVKNAIDEFGSVEQIIGKDLVPSSAAAAALPVRVTGTLVAGVTGVLKISRALGYTDVIGTPVAWVATTVYSATPGARSVVTNDGGRAYICTTGGTSAGSGGPTGEGTAIADGSVVWSWLGADIPVSLRQILLLDQSRMTIHSSSATP